MMEWFAISEERLAKEKEIETPIDLMTWEYFQYVKNHPVQKWNIDTRILFAGKDNLQSKEVVNDFAERFGCSMTVSKDSEHLFMSEGDGKIVEQWLVDNI